MCSPFIITTHHVVIVKEKDIPFIMGHFSWGCGLKSDGPGSIIKHENNVSVTESIQS